VSELAVRYGLHRLLESVFKTNTSEQVSKSATESCPSKLAPFSGQTNQESSFGSDQFETCDKVPTENSRSLTRRMPNQRGDSDVDFESKYLLLGSNCPSSGKKWPATRATPAMPFWIRTDPKECSTYPLAARVVHQNPRPVSHSPQVISSLPSQLWTRNQDDGVSNTIVNSACGP
jgi:hypothetical protein